MPSLASPAGKSSIASTTSAASPRDAAGLTAKDEGTILTSAALPGRRVWIDERLQVAQTPEAFRVRCGKHQVRIGSTGKAHDIEVPCGGEIGVK